ncbi:MAG: FG-GAP-like repeat-containing protein [Planctomycetota bacterium]
MESSVVRRLSSAALLAALVAVVCAGTTSAQPTFSASAPIATGPDPRGVALGDADLDGLDDLAVAIRGGFGQIVYFRNSGGGVFSSPIVMQFDQVGAQPTGLAFTQLDADSRPDLLASVENGQLGLFFNSGGRSAFTQDSSNNVAPDGSSSAVSASFGNRGSSFRGLTSVSTGAAAEAPVLPSRVGDGNGGYPGIDWNEPLLGTGVAIAIGYFDGNADTYKDIAVLRKNRIEAGGVVVPEGRIEIHKFIGDGVPPDGAFEPPQGIYTQYLGSVVTGPEPTAMVSADFNCDGLDDLAVACAGDRTLRFYYGIAGGNGTFTEGTVVAIGCGPTALVAGDFDSDGAIDVAVSTSAASVNSSALIGGLAGAGSPVAGVANDVSGDGTVVVGTTATGEAFRWTSSNAKQLLGKLAGETTSAALRISDDGTTIVGTSGLKLFRWRSAEGMVDLGLPAGAATGTPVDLTGDGSKVLVTASTGAFIWQQGSGYTPLETYLSQLGVNMLGSTLTSVQGMSDDGLRFAAFEQSRNSYVFVDGRPGPGTGIHQIFGDFGSVAKAISGDGSSVLMSSSVFRIDGSGAGYLDNSATCGAGGNPLSQSQDAVSISGNGTLVGGSNSIQCFIAAVPPRVETFTYVVIWSGDTGWVVTPNVPFVARAFSRDGSVYVGEIGGNAAASFGLLTEGVPTSAVTNLSADGKAVLGTSVSSSGVTRQMRWTATAGAAEYALPSSFVAAGVPAPLTRDGTAIVGDLSAGSGAVVGGTAYFTEQAARYRFDGGLQLLDTADPLFDNVPLVWSADGTSLLYYREEAGGYYLAFNMVDSGIQFPSGWTMANARFAPGSQLAVIDTTAGTLNKRMYIANFGSLIVPRVTNILTSDWTSGAIADYCDATQARVGYASARLVDGNGVTVPVERPWISRPLQSTSYLFTSISTGDPAWAFLDTPADDLSLTRAFATRVSTDGNYVFGYFKRHDGTCTQGGTQAVYSYYAWRWHATEGLVVLGDGQAIQPSDDGKVAIVTDVNTNASCQQTMSTKIWLEGRGLVTVPTLLAELSLLPAGFTVRESDGYRLSADGHTLACTLVDSGGIPQGLVVNIQGLPVLDRVAIAKNNKAAPWAIGTTIDVGPGPTSLATGDVNADARLDLAVGFSGGDQATVLLNTTTVDCDATASVRHWSARDPFFDTTQAPRPSARSSYAAAYCTGSGAGYLFGGVSGSTRYADLWKFDGLLWQQVTPVNQGPSARDGATMVYDTRRNRMMMFGGFDGSAYLSDLWEYDLALNRWFSFTGGFRPTGRARHAAVFDSNRNLMYIHGGWNGALTNDSWDCFVSGSSGSWSRRPTTPNARYSHTAAYDPIRARTVIHGGVLNGVTLADTWELNFLTWTQVASGGPTARYGHTMYYNWLRKSVEIFGGWSGMAMADSWGWDGAIWKNLASSIQNDGLPPAPRYDATAMYLQDSGAVLVFGGLETVPAQAPRGDSWELFDSDNATSATIQGPSSVYLWDRATFSVVGQRTYAWRGDVRYQWRRNGVAIVDGLGISGARTDTISVDAFTHDEAGRYDCMISTVCGTTITRPHTVTYLNCISPTNTTVVGLPVFCVGQTIQLGSTWDSSGPAPTFRWYKDGQILYNYGSTSGVTTPTLTITNPSAADAGSYSIRVMTTCGYQDSPGFALRALLTNEVAITSATTQVTPDLGATFDLQIAYGSCLNATVQWYGPTGAALSEGGRFTGTGTTHLRVTDARFEDSGTYTVRVTTATGSAESHPIVNVVCARGTWTEALMDGLSARSYAAIATDTTLGRTILFGGHSLGASTGTWAFDGQTWTLLATVGAEPPGRESSRMAYDRRRQKMVMVGGSISGVQTGETWEFDGVSWALASVLPTNRLLNGMAYDELRREMVTVTDEGDTYAWDGTAWLLKGPAPSVGLYGAGLAFDPDSGKVILFGGQLSTSDTWAWDGTAWTRIATLGPPARTYGQLTFDPSRGRVVLHGGNTGEEAFDTWVWNGSAWEQILNPGTPPRNWASQAVLVESPRGDGLSFIGGYATGTEKISVESLSNGLRRVTAACQPHSASVTVGSSLDLSSCVTGTIGSVSYKWLKDGVILTNGLNSNGGVVSGAISTSLHVAPMRPGDEGFYTFVATDQCGSSYSVPAYIKVEEPGCLSHHAEFIALGNLGGSPAQSYAGGISPDGTFATGFTNGPSGREGFVWSASGGMVGLGDLAGGNTDSIAVSSSQYAQTIVGLGFDATGKRAVLWSPGQLGPISSADLSGGVVDASGRDVSGDGAVRVGQASSALGLEAFFWNDLGIFPLGDLAGGTFLSNANSISFDASTIVGYGSTGAGQFATRWVNGGAPSSLGELPGGAVNSSASGVSGDGSMIVGSSSSAAGVEAFYWTQGEGMISIGDLPGGTVNGVATNVSASGEVVVGNGTTSVGAEAFIWTRQIGMRRLVDVLADQGVLLPVGWRLAGASDVSGDGLTIAGRAIRADGAEEAVVVRLRTLCGADFNHDGAVDFFDYDEFVACFEGQGCPQCTTADFDADGTADFFDYDAFVVAFESGC